MQSHPGGRNAGRQVVARAQAAGRAEGQAARRMDGDAGRGRGPRRPQAASAWSTPCRHLAQGRRGLVITYKDIEDDFAGDRGRRGRALRSHRGHRPLGRRRRRGDHRPAAAQAGRHRADGRRHHRQAGHRRAHDRAAPADPSRPLAGQIIKCRIYGDAGGRDDPAGRHRGGHRSGDRAGSGASTGRQPTRSRCSWSSTTSSCPACRSTRWSILPTSSPTPSTT